MWTSGDPLCAFSLVTKIRTPLVLLLFLLCIVQQPLRAVCCFSSPSTCINWETICHQHSGSVGVNKPQEPVGETQMTQACPSNWEEVIFGFCLYLRALYLLGVVYICLLVMANSFVHLYRSWKTNLGSAFFNVFACIKWWNFFPVPTLTNYLLSPPCLKFFTGVVILLCANGMTAVVAVPSFAITDVYLKDKCSLFFFFLFRLFWNRSVYVRETQT